MLRVSPYKIRFASSRPFGPCAQSHRRGERGQSIVETILSLIILLTVLFGIIQCSLAAYSYHFIAEAAREGARYAMVRGSACTTFPSACPASSTDIQNYVTGMGFPGIDTRPAAMTVTVTCGPAGATPASTCSAGNNDPGDLVLVKITYRFPLAIPFVPTSTITMGSSSQITISQ